MATRINSGCPGPPFTQREASFLILIDLLILIGEVVTPGFARRGGVVVAAPEAGYGNQDQ
jgi:hypothetical protein